MKRFAAALLLSLLAWCPAAAARTVRVSFYDSPGCHDVAPDGTKSGYGHDFMQELAAKAGWQVEYVGNDWSWDRVLEMLEKGELDMVDFVTPRPDRAEKMLFSRRPMSYTGCAIRTFPDRAGRYSMAAIDSWGHVRVGVMKGDATGREFLDFAHDYRLDFETREFDTEAEGVEAMRRGELDLVAFEELVSFPELTVIEICKPFSDHVAVRRDNPGLMAEIDAAMAAMDRDDPGWMTRLHQKYFPSPTIYAYLPVGGERPDWPLVGYLRELLGRLDEVLARKIEIRECRADFSDADFSLPSFACGVDISPARAERFRFPLQPAGSRRVELLAAPGDAAAARTKLKGAGGRPVRVGCPWREGGDARRIFERYALQNAIAFELVPAEGEDELRGLLLAGGVDLALCLSGRLKDLPVVDSCGSVDFYLAPPESSRELAGALDKALKYLRFEDSAYLPDLENRHFGVDGGGRTVRLGAYVENGLSVRRPDGSYAGFVIDFMDEIARRAGWRLRTVPMSYPEAQRALADGAIDVMGAAVWTEERARVYDYSKFDVGPLYYALMKRRDGTMLGNRPDTWNGARIGYQRGSLSVKDLELLFKGYGVGWRGESFNDLRDAERLVRAGRLDAVYTLASEDNRDLEPLVMLPTKLCYFCSNRRKPWIKAEMDAQVETLQRGNHRWIADLYERHLATAGGVLLLAKDEIDYVRERRGHPVRVAFLDGVEPLAYRDAKTGEVRGLVRQLFDRISAGTGLEFEYLSGESPADVLLKIDGAAEERTRCLCVPDWYRMPVCRVRRREPAPAAKGIAAVMKSRGAEAETARRRGLRPIVLETREDCYRAVLEGRAEYLVDDLPVAMKRLDVEKRHEGLFYQRVDLAELSRPIALYTPAATDPRLRTILGKARDALPPGEADLMLFSTLYGGGRPLSMKVKSVLLTAFLTVLVAGALLFLTHHHLRVARAADRAKSAFLSNMSHDIRTPMNAILGFSEIAIGHLGDQAKVGDCLNKVKLAGVNLLEIIDDILDMSKIESGKVEIVEQEGNVSKMREYFETILSQRMKERNQTFVFSAERVRDDAVWVDKPHVNRVLQNLLTNAVKYTPEGGTIRFTVEQLADRREGYATFRFTVEDNGIGMSREFQKRLFERFTRERNSTVSGIQGTGIGMSITKALVDALGGTVSVESEEGKGTKFTLVFDFRRRVTEEKVKSKGEKVKSAVGDSCSEGENGDSELFHLSPLLFTSPRTRRILLVEDNEINREIALEILRGQGFEVDVAVNGREAVEKVCGTEVEKVGGGGVEVEKVGGGGRRNINSDHHCPPPPNHSTLSPAYDLVLMDIQMPVMNGLEATKAIRAWEAERNEQLIMNNEQLRNSPSSTEHCPANKDDHHNYSLFINHYSLSHLPIIALSANAFAEDREASLAAGMDDHLTKPIKVRELLEAIARFSPASAESGADL